MPEIGTSGLISGEEKRSVAAWPKQPRSSSTLLPRRIFARQASSRVETVGEIGVSNS